MNSFFRVSVVVAVTILMCAPVSHASLLVLDLTAVGPTVSIADNGAGDSDPTVGRIVNTSTIGGFLVAITIAQSNSPGNSSLGLLQVQSLDIRNTSAGTAALNIRVSDTDFTLPGGPFDSMTLGSAVGGTFTSAALGDSVTFTSYADPLNGQPAIAVSTATLPFIKSTGANPESFSGSDFTNWVRGAGNYSLANITHIVLSPNAQLNISGTTTTAVPEPATAGLITLAGATLLLLRRRSH